VRDIWDRLDEYGKELRRLASDRSDEALHEALARLDSLVREGRRRDEEREALLREVVLVLSCTAVERVFHLIMDAVIRLSRAERGFLILCREDGSQEVAAARNMARQSVSRAAQEISRRVVVTVLTEGRTMRLTDALHTPPFSLADSVTRLKLLSVLCVPVRVEGKVLGAVYLENRKATGVFGPETERLIEEFAGRIGVAILNARTMAELRRSREDLQAALAREYAFEGVVGQNLAFRKVLHTVSVAARSDIPILIEGESGTGKELLAHAIHFRSPRREGPFVSVNCAALPHALLESELFGHTRGAFTGAMRDRPGLFATAHGGTLFLDEVGEMSPALQAKLLRVLQSGEYRRLGSDRTLRADVRVVAATQRDLEREVASGRFRQDLFFRLNGVHVRVPPLRQRKEDIPLLVGRFLEKYGPRGEPLRLDDEARACLLAYDYPGNVRELETIVRRAVLFARSGRIGVEALPRQVVEAGGERISLPLPVPSTAAELLLAKKEAKLVAVKKIERAFLTRALASAGGRPGEAARRVGMNRSQFARMLSRHGLAGRRRTGATETPP